MLSSNSIYTPNSTRLHGGVTGDRKPYRERVHELLHIGYKSPVGILGKSFRAAQGQDLTPEEALSIIESAKENHDEWEPPTHTRGEPSAAPSSTGGPSLPSLDDDGESSPNESTNSSSVDVLPDLGSDDATESPTESDGSSAQPTDDDVSDEDATADDTPAGSEQTAPGSDSDPDSDSKSESDTPSQADDLIELSLGESEEDTSTTDDTVDSEVGTDTGGFEFDNADSSTENTELGADHGVSEAAEDDSTSDCDDGLPTLEGFSGDDLASDSE
jgi:hypothetical protein